MAIVKKEFGEEETNIYLDSLCYILNIDKKPNEKKLNYLRTQAFEMCYDMRKLKTKTTKKASEIISALNRIGDIRIRRYILRDMIMLSIADHELTDKDIDNIYEIGTKSGIAIDKIDDFFLWAAKAVEWQIEGIKLVEEDL